MQNWVLSQLKNVEARAMAQEEPLDSSSVLRNANE